MALRLLIGRRLLCLPAIALVCSACGDSNGHSGEAAAATPAVGNVSPVRTQPLGADPCGWVPLPDVERIIGRLGATPVRVRNAEQFDEPDPNGSACRYELEGPSEDAPAFLAIGVVTEGVSAIETGLGATFGAMGLSALGGSDDRDSSTAAPGRWDWKTDLPPGALGAARQGHVAIMTTARALRLSTERVDSLAAAMIDRIPDLPFGERSTSSTTSSADPCALLTQAEAEAVLGPLVVAPYRSRESTPIANPSGTSCAFFTAKHHVLVLTPTREDGRMVFRMMSGMAQQITASLGVNAAADTLLGSWDESARGIDGTLYFLKGDRMLELQYRTSSTDLAGAVRLAAAAHPRL